MLARMVCAAHFGNVKKMYKKAHSARLAEVKSFLGNAHMETTHIKKGLS